MNRFWKTRSVLLAALCALSWLFFGPARAADFLPPEQAFQLEAKVLAGGTVEVRYAIAPGYYMYRERFAFSADGARLGQPVFPAGQVHFDETFQKDVETYRDQVAIRVPVTGAGQFRLTVTGQGCSDQGLCYPPMHSTVDLALPQGRAALTAAAPPAADDADGGRIERALAGGRLAVIMPLFLLLGVGLAFTPCVLPMLPILSSIIVGQRGVTRARGLALSLSYSLGMAIVYTCMGVAAGLAGQGLAAALQNAWVLGAFALLMVALSLSMFGLYELQLPAALQARLANTSNRQASGSHIGVFVMGALSALIVGPCVAAPLAGALLYISQTGNAFIGGSALFAMAAGMSLPLLLVGASAGALLPRAGAWMDGIKRVFGVLMLGTALWIVGPVLPPRVVMAGWAVLALGCALWLLRCGPRRVPLLAAGLLFAITGGIELAGLAAGGSDPLAPFAAKQSEALAFRRVHSVQELDAALASSGGKSVMLDFYADWCVSCKEMEKFTFADPRVRARLGQLLLLQADVTANDAADQALLKRFHLFGPPGIMFFTPDGAEVAPARVIGYQDADQFLQSLDAAAARPPRLSSIP